METPFFAQGLRFGCTRCSRCCRHDPGHVFLTRTDLDALTAGVGLDEKTFVGTYCRPVTMGGRALLSLKEKPNYDCIFWESGGCRVYPHRPFQCRSFPFWSSILASESDWRRMGEYCPGIGRGRTHSREEIEAWLAGREGEPVLEFSPERGAE